MTSRLLLRPRGFLNRERAKISFFRWNLILMRSTRAWYIYWSCGIKRLRVALWGRRWKRWRSTSARRLKRFSISARAFDAHYQAFLFYSGTRYIRDQPFSLNGTPIPRPKPPVFLICLGIVCWGHIVVLRLTKFQRQDWIN